MNPLDPDKHKTGKWNFTGKNLSPDEVEALTKKGVDWSCDIMPDGRLKLPKFRRTWRQKTLMPASLTEDQITERDDARRKEYEALEDPKPDYFEWAANRHRHEQFAELERIAYCAGRTSDRLKALHELLEFSKSRPKQQLELSSKEEQETPLDAKQLLQLALELNGMTLADVRPATPQKAN